MPVSPGIKTLLPAISTLNLPKPGARFDLPGLAGNSDALAIAALACGAAQFLLGLFALNFLLAIPAMIPPERAAPTGAESDEQLCAGISVSAQRLKAAAFAVSREPGNSIALSGGLYFSVFLKASASSKII